MLGLLALMCRHVSNVSILKSISGRIPVLEPSPYGHLHAADGARQSYKYGRIRALIHARAVDARRRGYF